MINFELSPSVFIGIILLIVAIALYFIRIWTPSISQDYDLIFSSMGVLCGGILIFQGWRLDPILLFSQILSNIMGVFFIWEAIQLRKQNRSKYTDNFNSFFKIKNQSKNFHKFNKKKITFSFLKPSLHFHQIVRKKNFLHKELKKDYYNPLDFN
uniref:Ycf66 n=1 Tax=Nitella hyalina TaxID=181804 RepID=A0A2H4G592_NITHY|nr:hypothetical chloroplast RF66 [Nitella hyalina]APP89492.1 hypothetical protein [Nitella hyalina]WKT08458.1 hypothetical chloroplast RF66 [Nitella hyalina]